MKKKIIAAMMLCVTVIAISAQKTVDEEYVKIGNLNDKGYRFMSGFGFADTEVDAHSDTLEERVDAEIDRVLSGKAGSTSSDYAVVGHSQGGLRAIAYATRLKQQHPEEYKKLKAVITVSGIDKGLKALDGCSEVNRFTPFKAKLENTKDILLNGTKGVLGASLTIDALAAIAGIILTPYALYWLDVNSSDVYDTLTTVLPYFNSYITAGLDNAPYSVLPEIYDMMPRSSFIENNVSKTKSIVYKRKTGENKYLTWTYKKVFGIKIYYLTIETKPVYTTYTAYFDMPKFDPDLPMGYIVGTDSNTLGMLGSDMESNVRNGIGYAVKGLDIANGINLAKYYITFGILGYHKTFATYCSTASDWLSNIDGELNKLKGSDENDGLVAKESQFYPKTFYNPATKQTSVVHLNVLSEKPEGYTALPYNHADINPGSNLVTQSEIDNMLLRARGWRYNNETQ